MSFWTHYDGMAEQLNKDMDVMTWVIFAGTKTLEILALNLVTVAIRQSG